MWVSVEGEISKAWGAEVTSGASEERQQFLNLCRPGGLSGLQTTVHRLMETRQCLGSSQNSSGNDGHVVGHVGELCLANH